MNIYLSLALSFFLSAQCAVLPGAAQELKLLSPSEAMQVQVESSVDGSMQPRVAVAVVDEPAKELLDSADSESGAGAGAGLGKVLSTKKQVESAAAQATKIKEHDPNLKTDVSSHAEVRRPTVAVALGGGGARGAAHIGVLKVLQENGIPVDYIVGTSMGAIIGGLYCAGVPLDEIQGMLADKSLRKAYIGHVPPKILLAPLAKLMHPFGSKKFAGLWTGDKFEKFISAKLPQSDMLVSDTKIPFSVVATNLLDGQAYRISDGRLSTAIRASASIAPILKPIMIGDKLYCDGGVRANLPAGAARETGADIVIAVQADEPLKPMPPEKFRRIAGIALRLTDIVLAVSDERQMMSADVVLVPDVSHVAILSKNGKDVERVEAAGEAATRKALPAIRKKMEEKRRGQDIPGSFAAAKDVQQDKKD